MQSEQERKEAFLTELNALLIKYDATIELESHVTGYYTTSTDIKINLESKYEDGECVHPWVELDLGSYYDGK